MNRRILLILAGIGLLVTVPPAMTTASAKEPVVPINQENGVAVRGTDVVAYFTDSKPIKGKSEFSWQWMGATWWFASAEHLELFKANPEKYAPQYGGYCSYAVSKGHIAGINPNNWKIVEETLYLNHTFAQGLWEQHIRENIQKANQNWPEIQKAIIK